MRYLEIGIETQRAGIELILSALMKLGAVRPAGKDGRRTLYERVNPQGVKQP